MLENGIKLLYKWLKNYNHFIYAENLQINLNLLDLDHLFVKIQGLSDIFEGKIELFNPILLIMVELISLKFISPAQIGFIDRVILGGFNSHINEVKDQTFENIIGVV